VDLLEPLEPLSFSIEIRGLVVPVRFQSGSSWNRRGFSFRPAPRLAELGRFLADTWSRPRSRPHRSGAAAPFWTGRRRKVSAFRSRLAADPAAPIAAAMRRPAEIELGADRSAERAQFRRFRALERPMWQMPRGKGAVKALI
jgi:hypothetical protein